MDPATLHAILIGTAGDASGGLIAGILTALAGRVARRFQPEPRQKALLAAFEQALPAAFAATSQSGPLTHYYLDSLTAFLRKDIVREELALLLNPGEDAFDLKRLRQVFTDITQGYPPDVIPDLQFEPFVAALAHNFALAVRGQPDLQEVIKIERLDTLVSRFDALLKDTSSIRQAAVDTATQTRRAADTLADVNTTMTQLRQIAEQVAAAYLQQFAPTSAEEAPTHLQAATTRYLAYLLDRYRYLDFQGMGMADRVALTLPLLDMYVPLKARVQLPEGETWSRDLKLAGRRPTDEEMAVMGHRLSEPQPLLDLLRKQDGLIILGDPGAGKTTFLKYLAVRLALGEGDALGVGPRLPLLIPLFAYGQALQKKDVPLDEFLPAYYRAQGIRLPLDDMLAAAVRQGGVLFLLDGLDEVPSLSLRHLVVEHVRTFVAFHRQAGNKFILTSRIVGYLDVRPNDKHLTECTLVDFEQEEIEAFVARWSEAVERAIRGRDADSARRAAETEQEALLFAISHNQGVRQLAANPLLLTILALMKRQGVALPERRVELYDQYVRTLVRHWLLARGLDRRAAHEIDAVETVRILGTLALWMQQTSPDKGLVRQAALQRQLVSIFQERNRPEPETAARQLLIDAREHAGLLVERGGRTYGFIHKTFQEYLAAVGIAQQGQTRLDAVIELLAEHVADDYWHEVTLLTIGYMGLIQQRDEAAGEVLLRLIARDPGLSGQATALAGEAVLDAWPGGVTAACRLQVVQALETVVQSTTVAAAQRVAAGAVLGRLGDTRPGVTVLPAADAFVSGEAAWLPDIQFCFVPAGPTWSSEDDESGHVVAILDYPYWISRFPITNAQFHAFVVAGGYAQSAYWTEAECAGVWRDNMVKGWEYLDKEPRAQPYDFGPPFNLPNHPVVGVTWYEMLAFTRWLTAQLNSLPAPWRVQLPSEAEWEKAARGGLRIPVAPQPHSLDEILPALLPDVTLRENPLPRRRYPWGETRLADKLSPALANYEKEHGVTNAVGCYAAGRSPYGCEEMVGNVWEWTRSQHRSWPYNPRDGREDVRQVTNNDSIAARGGSWWNEAKFSRCGVRSWNSPDYWDNHLGFRVVLSPFTAGL